MRESTRIAIKYAACPRCGAKPGERCVQPSGKPITPHNGYIHGARRGVTVTEIHGSGKEKQ